jgi:hypothetical protein
MILTKMGVIISELLKLRAITIKSFPLLDFPITEKDFIGKVTYVIPGVGAFRSFK